MNWFKKLFGIENSKNGKGTVNDLHSEFNFDDTTDVLEDVFVDNEPPEAEDEIKFTSKLWNFFSRDFANLGFHEGYSNHSKEKMNQITLKIKAEFRFETDQLINRKKAEILKLEQSRIEVDGLSDETVRKIDLQLKHNTEQIDELESQKALSADDEGWVMSALHEYQNGYANGTKAYHDENKLLGTTDLFI